MSAKPSKSTLLLFDLGLVVVDVDLSTGAAVWQALTGRKTSEFNRLFFDSGIKYRMDIGEMSADEAVSAISELTEYQVIPELILATWNSVLTIRPDMSAAIRALSLNYRCDVISNTDPIHAAWIQEECGIMDAITHWTFSFDNGHMKPQEPLFQEALDAAEVPAAQVLLLDDRRDNVATATSMGMDTMVVQNVSQALNELRARGFELDA